MQNYENNTKSIMTLAELMQKHGYVRSRPQHFQNIFMQAERYHAVVERHRPVSKSLIDEEQFLYGLEQAKKRVKANQREIARKNYRESQMLWSQYLKRIKRCAEYKA